MAADWSFPTRIRIGPDRIVELATACAEAGIRRPLVVTDVGLADSRPIARSLEVLDGHRMPYGLYASVEPDPNEACIVAGAAAAAGHDGIVSIGGGSALDAGKLIALAAASTGSILAFAEGSSLPPPTDDMAVLPIITVPTTAGTGSEVGRAGVVTDVSKVKRIIFHPSLMARSVICDPVLTTGMPRPLTVGTGMDALSHALEAYCSPAFHPLADGIAVEAIGLALGALPVAAEEPDHLGARQQMQAAALMGATAFQKGLGAMHSLSHPLGAWYRTHHGTTNAVVMPYVLDANRSAIDKRISRLSAALGLGDGFDDFVDAVVELRDALGVPSTLADLGVPDSAIDVVRHHSPLDPTAATNPIPVDARYVEAVFEAAFTGRRDTV